MNTGNSRASSHLRLLITSSYVISGAASASSVGLPSCTHPSVLLLQFVAHPNCQQHLTSIWYGQQMGFMQSLTLWKQLAFWLVCIVLLPVICLVYIVAPNTQVRLLNRSLCFQYLRRTEINPLECRRNYNATSNNTKLVYWPLMDGLLHLIQRYQT